MTSRLSRLGVLISASEATLAVANLAAAWMMRSVAAGVESDAYNAEAASGFLIGYFVFWLSSLLVLVVIVVLRSSVRVLRSGEGVGPVLASVPRVAVELVVAALLALVLFTGGVPPDGLELFLAAGALVGLSVLVHRTVDAWRAVQDRRTSS